MRKCFHDPHRKKRDKKSKSKGSGEEPQSDNMHIHNNSSRANYNRSAPQKYSAAQPNGYGPERGYAPPSNQTSTKTYDEEYTESVNRKRAEERESYDSGRMRASDSQEVKASKRPLEHSSDPNRPHISDKGRRNIPDSYPIRTSEVHSASQPPVQRPSIWHTYPPSRHPVHSQQHAFPQTHVGQYYHPYYHQNPQQVPQVMHPTLGQPTGYGVPQHPPQPVGYTVPHHPTISPPHAGTQPNSLLQGNPVSQPYAPNPTHLASQMQGTAQPVVQPHQYVQNHAQLHHPPAALRKTSSAPNRLPSSMISDPTVQTSDTLVPKDQDCIPGPQQVSHPSEEKNDVHTSKSEKHQSLNQSEEHMPSECASQRKPDLSTHAPDNGFTLPGLALIGNPGAGKSTILNGVANGVVFAAGISLGSGLTSSVNEHVHNGFSLFDTPGLADVERKKEAGHELDALLSKQIPLRIAFVVTLERGRVRPEDALTIDLVLDSIKDNTDYRFGVVINMVTKRVGEAIEASAEIEAKIRRSLTGRHRTYHWCYVSLREDLEDESDRKLTTPDLEDFFLKLPVTKATDARTVPIDTDDMEEKQKKHVELIRDIEAQNAEMLREMTEELMMEKARYAEMESQFRRDEQRIVDEIQRLQAETAAAKEAYEREQAERASRRHRQSHHSRHRESESHDYEDGGHRQRSRQSNSDVRPLEYPQPPGSGARNSDIERHWHDGGRDEHPRTYDSSVVPTVHGIHEEDDRWGKAGSGHRHHSNEQERSRTKR